MYIQIDTQYLENYGLHDEPPAPRWKYKGGDVYLVKGITVAQAMSDLAGLVKEISAEIEYHNDASEEYIIGWELRDDVEPPACEEWMRPIELVKNEEGVYARAK